MIKYPNGKKSKAEAKPTSTSNRGMALEKDINQTNLYYLDNDLANVHKKPTPVQIIKVDYPKRSAAKITEAYFKVPSTTDYNGVYKGRALDFEAKECHSKTSFPFSSIHPHQINHLESVIHHGAIAFVIIRFNCYEETYLIKAQDIIEKYKDPTHRSLPYSWVQENGYLIPYHLLKPVDYLKVLDTLYF